MRVFSHSLGRIRPFESEGLRVWNRRNLSVHYGFGEGRLSTLLRPREKAFWSDRNRARALVPASPVEGPLSIA